MRVVIDGLPLEASPHTIHAAGAGAGGDRPIGASIGPMLDSLLHSWSHQHGDDELHLIVDAHSRSRIDIPSWVTVHEVSSKRHGPFGRLYARLVRVPRLCRALKAHVLLGVRHTGKVAALAYPRRTVVYDVFDQPEADTAATASRHEPEGRMVWSRFAHRLRVHLVDAVARADWIARGTQLRPTFLRPVTPSALTVNGAAVVDTTVLTRLRTSMHPRRSVRWIAAASASTLAISAAAAASVDLAVSHSIPVSTPHQLGTTGGSTNPVTVGGGAANQRGTVPLPPPATSSTSTTSTSTTGPTSTTAPTFPPSSTPTSSTSAVPPAVTIPSLPTLTLPTLTLPTVTTPSLPIPGITCTTGSTQTTSPLQSIINLCTIGAGGLPLGSK